MKKLFTLIMVLFAATTMNAQDASSWKPGQEVTEELTWTNTKFTGDQSGWLTAGGAGVGWFYEESKCPTGSIEMYNNVVGAETYQVMWLPAGYYKFTIQGFYRPGSAWAAGWDTRTDQNGTFFCSSVTINESEDADGNIVETYTTNRESSMQLMLIVADAVQQESKVLTDDMCGDWQRDNGFTQDGLQYWVPNSMWGTSLYFDMGKYENELMFVNPEDSWVKIGVRKSPASISDDWIIFNNLRAYYVSDAGEAVQLVLAQEEFQKATQAANDLADEIRPNYGSLATLLDDEMIETDFSDATLEECNEGIAGINAIIEKYKEYYEQAKSLTDAINKCTSLSATFEDEALKTALEEAKKVEKDGTGDNEMTITDPEAYGKALEVLTTARANALKNVDPKTGADVTSFISYPWFCLPEYEPTWDEESQWWKPNEAAMSTVSLKDGTKTWAERNDVDGTELDIAKGCNVQGMAGTPGVWYQSGTSGGSLVTYWEAQLTCIKKWDTPHTGENEYHDVSQLIVDVPNGYYKLKGLAKTWANDGTEWCKNHIYIKSSTMESHSPYLTDYIWWDNDIRNWRELETQMIEVTDNQVIISSRDNGFGSFTGFRLFYYGENPDFTALLAAALEEANTAIDDLTFAGDIAEAKAILAQIPETIANGEEYSAALSTIADAKAFVNTAKAAEDKFNNVTMPKFADLAEKYAEGSVENEFLNTAYISLLDLGEGEGDTYRDANATANDYTAYVNYLSYRASAKEYESNAELAAILKEQADYLTQNYANEAKLAEFKAQIAGPYNSALIAGIAGVENASEKNPVDVTALIINPNYDELSTGWSGEMTVDSLGTVERWNVNCDISQTIYALPAGAYQVQVQAFYRDGGDASKAYNNFWYDLDDETGEWANPNAKLYANSVETSLASICSESFTDRSYTQYVDKWVKSEEGDAEGNDVYEPHWTYQFKKEVTNEETGEVTYEELTEETVSNDYPWDTKVEDLDEILFFPASLRGTACRFANSPKAYINKATVMVEEGGSLTIGIRKETLISNDWVTMDNWKLFYLGKEVPTSISNAQNATTSTIYNVGGVRQSKLQKGINILKQNDGTVRKVYVK